MAFDPQAYIALDAASDFSTIFANYLDASLLAGAIACIKHGISEWGSTTCIPSEEVFREVEPFSNMEDPIDPETAATLLLLVREALRH